jgi:hypothetical protein
VLTARAGDGSLLLRRPIDVVPDQQHSVELPEDTWVVTLEAPSRSRVELGKVRRSVALPAAPNRPRWREDSDTVMWWRWLRADWHARRRRRQQRQA